ncbi:MAG: PSD1 and planctomycete cytochrome C domain-containing protein [Pirellulaceae bacterium]
MMRILVPIRTALSVLAGLSVGLGWITRESEPCLWATEPAAAAFAREVAPILAKHCGDCHDGAEAEAQLRLTTQEGFLYGSASGRILVPGDSAGSLLLSVVAPGGKLHMPPEGQLTDGEIRTLARFVDSLPSDSLPARRSAGDASHWAYRPLTQPALPAVEDAAWVRTPIDRFVLARLEAAGLRPAAEADAATLCRRLYFDLVGLPPGPDEVADFMRAYAAKPAAYDELVDQLLASPRYGERWGRHWLDLARYADSGGFHEDIDRPHAWRYRDYVIRSFNDDKPYARFVAEQLAGDEIAPGDPDAWIATGFCRNGPSNDTNMGEGDAKERYRLDLLDDVLSTTSAVFLGQTIGCARCHDHKYDPITQSDYYRVLAVFDNTRRVDMAIDGEGHIVEARPVPKKTTPEEAARLPKASIMALTAAPGQPRATHVLWRGEVSNRGPQITPGVPVSLAYAPLRVPGNILDTKSAGRRAALAEWIGSHDNPLTWRVVANRIWQHHLGVGIVATPSNFGRTGTAPTHPELLDWLAQTILAHEGRWKPIHRLIVTSATYRQSVSSDDAGARIDPANSLLWRRNVRRLEAESLRDAVLAVAGTLNLHAGGPGMKPRIPADLLVASQRNKWPEVTEEGPAHWRRSVYIYVKRQLPFPLLELFDTPTTTQTCERRTESVVPTQALVLMNDEFTQEQAEQFADRVIRESGATPREQVASAVARALGRTASEVELCDGLAFLVEQQAAHRARGRDGSSAARAALADFCHVLFNCNEFAFVE